MSNCCVSCFNTTCFAQVIPTQGQVWPQPKAIRTSPSVLIIDPTDFEFILKTSDGQCDLATEAMRRHRQSLFSGCVSQKGPGVPLRTTKMNPSPTVAALHELDVLLVGPCETLPHMDMTESCEFH